MRREAQEILPNLLIGPYQSSRNLQYMQSLNLTHVLCISDAREAYVQSPFASWFMRVNTRTLNRHLVKPRFPDAFNYKVLEIRDAQDQNLIRIFPESILR